MKFNDKEKEESKVDLRRVILISIYTVLALGPASIWANLTMGLVMTSAAQFFALFLFSELMRLSAKPPKVQEAFLIYLLGSNISIGMSVLGWVYNAWLRTSSITMSFGFANQIPDWFAPPPSANILISRTFFSSAWTIPITLYLVFFFLSSFSAISLGAIAYRLYAKEENLPFPFAQISSQFCYSMVELKEEREHLFTIGAFIGLLWSFAAYGLPLISKSILEVTLSIIPVPWIEFNKFIEIWLPGASFGISTDLTNLVIGMIVPSVVAYSVFIGSFAFQFIGNYLLVIQGIFTDWTPGTSLSLTLQRSSLYYWASPVIGMALSAGIIPLFFMIRRLHLSSFTRSFSLRSLQASLLLPLFVFLGCSLVMVGIAYFLVPGYPIYIFLILGLGWSFLLTLISARSIGMTGLAISVPYVAEGLFVASGFKGIEPFFLPPLITVGGDNWCQIFKIADLTDTPISATIKPSLIMLPISLLVGFVSVAFLWSLFAIPSRFYPWTQQIWPLTASIQGLWISTLTGGRSGGQVLAINPTWIGIAFLALAIVQFIRIPVSAVSIALGSTIPIPSAFTMFLGLVVVRFIQRFKGKQWWIQYGSTFSAGMLLGLGIPIIIGAAVSLIVGSIWPMPY